MSSRFPLALAVGLATLACQEPSTPSDRALADLEASETATPISGSAAPSATENVGQHVDSRLEGEPGDAFDPPPSTEQSLFVALAPAAVSLAGRERPETERELGDLLVRFRVAEGVRTGRALFEYHLASSIQNQGSRLLRGTLRISSTASATRVIVDCVSFGTIPPGLTRDGEAPFVVEQDRTQAFDPGALHFAFEEGSTAAACEDSGRVTLRRLNRNEYDNSLRDLLGTTRRPARDFPADDFGYGFDTIADVLAISPLLVERIDIAAIEVVEEALAADPPSLQVAALRALCDPALEGSKACYERIFTAFARRAWRRPSDAAEVEWIALLADATAADTGSFDTGLADGLEAILVSPHFLFRVERDRHGRSAEVHPLSSHELATRLAYFLWSSTPDAELDALADAGELDGVATLRAQVARMIRDPRIARFVDDFAGQWLATRALDDANPDYSRFPNWGDPLRDAMRAETHAVFRDFATSDRSFLEILDPDFTYLNDALAAHYGLPLPGTSDVVRVSVPSDGRRGGILAQASLHTVTSHPQRTSVVKRGKWILEQLLCRPIDVPPAGVEGVLRNPGANNGGTLRQMLAAHRARPECASCHNYLDPLGLALENYGPIGGWRTADGGGPIDATGTLPDGRSFDGARELAAILAADATTARCIAERLLVYAIGRGLGASDETHLDAIAAGFAASGHRFEALLVAIVQSPPFRERRGEPPVVEN